MSDSPVTFTPVAAPVPKTVPYKTTLTAAQVAALLGGTAYLPSVMSLPEGLTASEIVNVMVNVKADGSASVTMTVKNPAAS